MNSIASIVLEDVNIEDNHDLLQIINKIDDTVKLQFSLPIDSIVDMFKYYVKTNIEHIEDIDEYDCVYPEVIQTDDDYLFTLNLINDDDSQADIKCLLAELKRQFGINFNNDCTLDNLFRVLLMDCADYDIINNVLYIKLYYDTYKSSWLKDFLYNY